MGPVTTMTEDNDGRFPDQSEVLVRYPLTLTEQKPGQSDAERLAELAAERRTWPWLPGTVEHQCGPDEWKITIEDRRLAELEDGTPAPDGTPDEDLLFPQCFRDASEIRTVPDLEAGQ
jgi:hypothetical protein